LALFAAPLPADPPAPGPGAAPAEKPLSEEERQREEARRRQEFEQRKADLPETAKASLALLEDFKKRELRLWSVARQRLVAQGENAVPALLLMLEETDWEMRAFAAHCLAARRSKGQALRPLVDALQKEKTFVEARRQLVLALAAQMDPDAVPALEAAAKDADQGIVLAAVRGIGMLQRQASADWLREHAKSANLDVRYEALGSLAILGDAATLRRLEDEAQALVAGDARRNVSAEGFDLGDRYRQYLLGVALSRAWNKEVDALLGDVLSAKKPWERKVFLRLGAAEGLGHRAGQRSFHNVPLPPVPPLHAKL
jgi:hypothetical protein